MSDRDEGSASPIPPQRVWGEMLREAMRDSEGTRYSLLARASKADSEDAWVELYRHYRSFLHYFLRGAHVEASHEDDLVQEVMISLMKNLHTFDARRGQFRPWLAMITRRVLQMHYRKLGSIQRKYDEYQHFQELCAHSDDTLDRMIKHQWENYLCEKAYVRVEQMIKGKAIEVFKRSLAGESVEQIKGELNLRESTVYNFRLRVKRSLIREIQALITETEGQARP